MPEGGAQPKPAAYDGHDKRGAGAPRIGRRVGQAVFWTLTVYIAASGTLSIINQVFASDPDPRQVAPECSQQLQRLKDDLLQRAANVVRRDVAEDADWFAAWDERYQRFITECEQLTQSHLQLRALRQRMEAWLTRFHREQRPLVRRLDAQIDALQASGPPPTREN